MTQGIFIHGRRPKSKEEIKEYIDGMYDPRANGCNCRRENDEAEWSTHEPTCSLGWTNDPYGLVIEATSLVGEEFDGSLAKALRSITNKPTVYNAPMEGKRFPKDKGISFVGPDPYNKRNFYGTIKYDQKKERFVVK